MQLLVGLILGILGSSLVWVIVRAIRPRLEISKALCVNPDGIICAKIINKGRRKTIDLSVYCFTLRGAADHRYPDSINIGIVALNPHFVPVLLGKSNGIRKAAGLSLGRIIKLGITDDGSLELCDFLTKYPHGFVLVHALATDSFSGSRIVASQLIENSKILSGVFHRDNTSIISKDSSIRMP